jgi:hypothetical protein
MSSLSAGSTAAPGTYTCANCTSTITLHGTEPLPTCESCGGTSWLPSGPQPDKTQKPVGSI